MAEGKDGEELTLRVKRFSFVLKLVSLFCGAYRLDHHHRCARPSSIVTSVFKVIVSIQGTTSLYPISCLRLATIGPSSLSCSVDLQRFISFELAQRQPHLLLCVMKSRLVSTGELRHVRAILPSHKAIPTWHLWEVRVVRETVESEGHRPEAELGKKVLEILWWSLCRPGQCDGPLDGGLGKSHRGCVLRRLLAITLRWRDLMLVLLLLGLLGIVRTIFA